MQYYYEGPVCDLCKKIASACEYITRQVEKGELQVSETNLL